MKKLISKKDFTNAAVGLFNLSLPEAAPIKLNEFRDVLLKVLGHAAVPRNGQNEVTIGLAISGGVDSMALATLCSDLQKEPISKGSHLPRTKFKFKAFIVNHNARPGSGDEANAVKQLLHSKQNIPTQVLNIKWRDETPQTERITKFSGIPAKAPNFESLARERRYQLLGQACKESGVNSLLLAHHEDDRVETVMMRLINGHQMIGLSGMKERSAIPECYGMHGIHESGGLDQLSRSLSKGSSGELRASHQVQPERGGVDILRPLLGFSKDRLMATCRSRMSEWFEDNTNKDPTLTQRNAIRHLCRHHTLPTALQKPAILALAQRAREKSESRIRLADSWLGECKFANFESRVGSVEVVFPQLNGLKEYSALSQETVKDAAAELLRRVIMLVTPQQSVDLTSLHGALEITFPELFDHKPKWEPFSFTVSRLLFRPINNTGSAEQKLTWLLSRQPYSRMERLPLIKIDRRTPAAKHSLMPQQKPPTKIVESAPPVDWSSWTLYDGRFWIRLRKIFPGTLSVEPYQQSFKQTFVTMLSVADRNHYLRLIKKVAPDHIRWTLPCIRFQPTNGTEEDTVVLALPTLRLVARNWIEQDTKERLPLGKGLISEEWFEVRYRKVYTEGMVGLWGNAPVQIPDL